MSRPTHRVYRFVRCRIALQKLRRDYLYSFLRYPVDFYQVAVQFSRHHQAGVCSFPVIFQVCPAQHPIFADMHLFLRQRQIRYQIITLHCVCQLHNHPSFHPCYLYFYCVARSGFLQIYGFVYSYLPKDKDISFSAGNLMGEGCGEGETAGQTPNRLLSNRYTTPLV